MIRSLMIKWSAALGDMDMKTRRTLSNRTILKSGFGSMGRPNRESFAFPLGHVPAMSATPSQSRPGGRNKSVGKQYAGAHGLCAIATRWSLTLREMFAGMYGRFYPSPNGLTGAKNDTIRSGFFGLLTRLVDSYKASRVDRSRLALPYLSESRTPYDGVAPTLPTIQESIGAGERDGERPIRVSRHTGSLRVIEFRPGRWIWQYDKGAHGYADTDALALIGALEHIGFEVDYRPVTTDDSLALALARSLRVEARIDPLAEALKEKEEL